MTLSEKIERDITKIVCDFFKTYKESKSFDVYRLECTLIAYVKSYIHKNILEMHILDEESDNFHEDL
jgi:hypothetical protein